MDKLTDFKPIKRLVFPGLSELDCSGLLVIVGPNSSGKTQFLRDIKERISGEPRGLVVAKELEVDTPDHQSFLRCLKAEGYIYSAWDDNDQEQLVPMTTFVGTGQGRKMSVLISLNSGGLNPVKPPRGTAGTSISAGSANSS